ncbi:MAG: hypothetical protein IKF82_05370 [Bacilli bacterium]|nr:hypothetical protein [Bacilli bacterium]
MKYRFSAKKVKSECNDIGISDLGDWVKKLDGEIIDESHFLLGGEIGFCKGKLIHKDWCEPIEESSKTNSDELIKKITEFCEHSIKVIDDIADTVASDSDIGRAYAYHTILDIIRGDNND